MSDNQPLLTHERHAYSAIAGLSDALRGLRAEIDRLRLPLALPSADVARRVVAEVTAQIDDYLLPRLAGLDAPTLAVVGGSTGAGKSTLVNSLVRAPVSRSGVLRPTTLAPTLVCNPRDTAWFSAPELLPSLARSRSLGHPLAPDTSGARRLDVVVAPALAAGLALLDAPDVDSVVAENGELAAELFAAADMWVFVTTASRYADAVPWRLLRDAQDRGTPVAIVLDRVPAADRDAIALHLARMLTEQGLGSRRCSPSPRPSSTGRGCCPRPRSPPCAAGSTGSPATPDAGPRSPGAPSPAPPGRSPYGPTGSPGPPTSRWPPATTSPAPSAARTPRRARGSTRRCATGAPSAGTCSSAWSSRPPARVAGTATRSPAAATPARPTSGG
ncbi:hypothetical protein ACFQX7_19765 [Luedemannella flava]